MKRLVRLFIVLLVITASPLLVFAAENTTYKLDELDLSIDIPDNNIVFTRSIQSNDPHLSEYGLTKDDMESLMAERNIYLNAWDEDVNYEIIVTMTENPLSNFSLLSDTVLETLATGLSDQYKELGITFIKSETYQHQQAKFIKIYISQLNNDTTVYGLQYYTVYDGKAINIILLSYSGEIDANKENIIKSIVDSVQFNSPPAQNSAPNLTPSFVYTDKNTGVKFTVPENWSRTVLSKEREFLSAEFTSNLEDGLTIMYGGLDLWNELSSADKLGASRSDLNNSAFSKSDIADMLGLQEKDISTVTYGGTEYFKGVVTSTQSAYGINLTVTMTHLYYFDNGYVYNFQFNGTNTNPYYKDFEALLSSVEYPSKTTTKNQPTVTDSPLTRFFTSWPGLLFINLLITIIIHPTPIWIYRYAIRKEPVAPKAAKKIVIIDAIIVAAIMIIITAMNEGSRISIAAVLLWSRVCYSSLTKGFVERVAVPIETERQTSNGTNFPVSYQPPLLKEETEQPDAVGKATFSNEETLSAKTVYCRKCGTKLNSDSIYCHKCGTKVEKREHI